MYLNGLVSIGGNSEHVRAKKRTENNIDLDEKGLLIWGLPLTCVER